MSTEEVKEIKVSKAKYESTNLDQYKSVKGSKVSFVKYHSAERLTGVITGVSFDKRSGFVQFRIKSDADGHTWGKAPKDVTFLDNDGNPLAEQPTFEDVEKVKIANEAPAAPAAPVEDADEAPAASAEDANGVDVNELV